MDEMQKKSLLESGFVTQEQIDEAEGIQKDLRDMGVEPDPLPEILIQKGYLTQDQAKAVRGSPVEEGDGVLEIPGYEILGTIGKGGMGTVYKGFQKSMARDVAIKVLFPETATQSGYVERFFREARLAARVKHTNMIAAYDVGEHKGHYFLVMEYFPGRTLKTIIFEEDRIPSDKALDLVLQIARALENAHANKLVHRDIKPENIMVNDEGVAKLCDMGLAKELRPGVEEDKEVAGTPLYASPEQAAGSDKADIRSDIYSLGATFYHMLLGRPPFIGTDPRRILRMHIEDEVVPPAKRDPSVPKLLSDVIVQMMAKDPAQRFPHPTALVAHLERLRDAILKTEREAPKEGPASPPAAPEARSGAVAEPAPVKKAKPKAARRRARSSPALWIGVIAVVVLVVAGGLFVLGRGGSSHENGNGKKGSKGRADPKGGGRSDAPPKHVAPEPEPPQEDPTEVLYREAMEYMEAHPEDLAEAASRFRKAVEKGKGSFYGMQAARRAEDLEKRLAETEKKAFEKEGADARAFEEQGRLGWAITVYRNLLLKKDVKLRFREIAEREVDRLSFLIVGRWEVDKAAIEEMTGRGAFDEAVSVLREAVDRDRGYATRELLQEYVETDVEALVAELEEAKRAPAPATPTETPEQIAGKWEAALLRVLSEGLRPDVEGAQPLSFVDRFRVAFRLCGEALADPALKPAEALCSRWRSDLNQVVSLFPKVEQGFRLLVKTGDRVKLKTLPSPSKVAEVKSTGRQVFVRFESPSAMMTVNESFEALDEGGVITVLLALTGADGWTAIEHMAVGLLYLWSTPGVVEHAARRAEAELNLAGSAELPVEGYLALLEKRKPLFLQAGLQRRVEEALKRAKSAGKKEKAEALEELLAILKEHGDSPLVAQRKAEIEKAVSDLQTEAAPPKEVKIPFLEGKTAAYDEAGGRFEIRYEFARPQEMNDWVLRTPGDQPDQWYQHLLDKYLGRKPVANLRSGKVNLVGGGYMMWRPKLAGDLELEMEFCPLHGTNIFILFASTDSGGYAFHTDIDFQGLSKYGQTAGVEIPTGASIGISSVNLNWPQSVEPLREDMVLRLPAKAWYKIKVNRKGGSIKVVLFSRRGKEMKTFEVTDDRYQKGRIGLAILKSGVVFDNVTVKGRFEEEWFRRALNGMAMEETGDIPGEKMR